MLNSNPTDFWYVFLLVMLISLGAQIYITRTYARWANTRNSAGLNGVQISRQILSQAGITEGEAVLELRGTLYAPAAGVVYPRVSGTRARREREATFPNRVQSAYYSLGWRYVDALGAASQ
jgi:hypothetical protein